MEIYDESTLCDYEILRQRNIIANYEFMKSVGKNNISTCDFIKLKDKWTYHATSLSVGMYLLELDAIIF